MTWRNSLLALAAVAVVSACASTSRPAALEQANAIYASLAGTEASTQAEAEMIRAREAINDAEIAVSRKQNQEYVEGMSHIALRAAQTAQAANRRALAMAAADSFRTARLNRLVALSQAQRDSLARAQALSEAEVAVLRERNLLITAVAVEERQRADSLRVVAAQQAEQLNNALSQLRTLVVEITNLRQTSRGLVISLSDVLFDVDRATIKPGAERSLERIAAVLQQYPDHEIAVEGHTDATGPDEYNQRLSEQRAAAVLAKLVEGGVPRERINSKGLGETTPVATNATAAGRQQNRRVEVIVLGAGTLTEAAEGVVDSVRTDTTRIMIRDSLIVRPDTTVRPDSTVRPPR
ncbi:MAG TPA: OmpA family protein [Gemmatimonadaceae bacterium]|nr:OmpA family protein [Gemmatimonadaceae bacterium]